MSSIDMPTTTSGSQTQESSRFRSASDPFSPPLPGRLNSTGCKEIWLTFPEAQGDPLLPGIPNEITLGHVASNLSWRDFYILSTVSPAWCHAVRSRQVYDARVRSRATETLVVFTCVRSGEVDTSLCLYSMKDNSCYELPPLPPHAREIPARGIPDRFKCVVLHSKIYLVKVMPEFSYSNSTYVFDLAGQRQWQRCAGMDECRDEVGLLDECGVLDGKIYVFGGRYSSDSGMYRASEVYDPKEDRWTSIKPMKSFRYQHQVATVGDELYAYGGKITILDYFPARTGLYPDSVEDDIEVDYRVNSLEVYNPVKDEWKVVEPFRRQPQREFLGEDKREALFMARGKFYSMTPIGIHVYDMDRRLWTHLHSFSFDVIGPIENLRIGPCAVLAVDDELLAIVDWCDRFPIQDWYHDQPRGTCFLRSRGFGRENIEIVWQKAQIPSSFENWPHFFSKFFMSSIQL